MALPTVGYVTLDVPYAEPEPGAALDKLLDRPHVLSGSVEPPAPPSVVVFEAPPRYGREYARAYQRATVCPICGDPACPNRDDPRSPRERERDEYYERNYGRQLYSPNRDY
jgi:hypothetical protein